MTQHGVALFYTTSSVMQAEKLLVTGGYSIKLIPTPRQFSSDCGIALRFDWNRKEEIRSVLDRTGIEFDAMHLLEG